MSETMRVQRVPESWPVVHLEAAVPNWEALLVGGHVTHPRRLSLAELAALGAVDEDIDFHCVWGWSRPGERWIGVPLSLVLDAAGAAGSHVTVHSSSDAYSSCMPVDVAARGFLAWARDGVMLAPDQGGPLRFLPPPELWAYKGVKWASRIDVGDRFVPGFWESRVENPVGVIPEDVVRP